MCNWLAQSHPSRLHRFSIQAQQLLSPFGGFAPFPPPFCLAPEKTLGLAALWASLTGGLVDHFVPIGRTSAPHGGGQRRLPGPGHTFVRGFLRNPAEREGRGVPAGSC